MPSDTAPAVPVKVHTSGLDVLPVAEDHAEGPQFLVGLQELVSPLVDVRLPGLGLDDPAVDHGLAFELDEAEKVKEVRGVLVVAAPEQPVDEAVHFRLPSGAQLVGHQSHRLDRQVGLPVRGNDIHVFADLHARVVHLGAAGELDPGVGAVKDIPFRNARAERALQRLRETRGLPVVFFIGRKGVIDMFGFMEEDVGQEAGLFLLRQGGDQRTGHKGESLIVMLVNRGRDIFVG